MERNRIKRKQGFVNGITIFLCTVMLFVGIFNMNMTSIHSEAAGISLNYTKATLDKGQQLQLQMKGTSKKVKWASSNKSVATVSSTGLVTAKKSGRATITARIGRKKYRCKITVTRQEHLYLPSYAVMSGNKLYVAIGAGPGYAGGGPLYVYNTSTKSKKKISDLGCRELSEKGNYIYCTVDDYYGSDGSRDYIYRISKNGKKATKLASGRSPIIIGNYLYYIAVKKEYGANGLDQYVDAQYIGIYRMNLNGSNKKCIYTFDGDAGSHLIAGKNRLFVDGEYSISLNGKNKKRVNLSANAFNTNATQDVYFTLRNVDVCSNTDGYVYIASGNSVYRKKGNTSKKLHTFASGTNVAAIVDCGKYICVGVTDSNYFTDIYVMTKKGKNVKKICTAWAAFSF